MIFILPCAQRRVLATRPRPIGVALALCAVALTGCLDDPRLAGAVESDSILVLQLRTRVNGYETEFGRVGAISADEDGQMYVADILTQEIAILDDGGRRIGTIGGSGDGPGEFRRLLGSLAWSGDLLVAVDQGRQRLVLFGRDGRVAGSRAWPGPFMLGGSAIVNGGTRTFGRMLVRGGFLQVGTPTPPPTVMYFGLDPDNSIAVLPALVDSVSWPQGVNCLRRDGRVEILALPFADWGPLRAFTPSGDLVVANRDVFAIDIVDPRSGEVLRSIQHSVLPEPLDDADWEAVPEVARLRQFERESGGGLVLPGDRSTPCPIDEMRPALFPTIRAIVTDEVGRLWVEAWTADGFRLFLFDTEGALLGQTAMPDRDARVAPFARNDRLYLATIDELDVQSIEVYELAEVR